MVNPFNLKNIRSKSEADKAIKILGRCLYIFFGALLVVRMYLIPDSYYEIVFDFLNYETTKWELGFNLSLYLTGIIAFVTYFVVRLRILSQKLSTTKGTSTKFFLWFGAMVLLSINSIMYAPFITGFIFWLFYSLATLSLGSVNDFLKLLDSDIFRWFSFGLVIVYSIYTERVLKGESQKIILNTNADSTPANKLQ